MLGVLRPALSPETSEIRSSRCSNAVRQIVGQDLAEILVVAVDRREIIVNDRQKCIDFNGRILPLREEVRITTDLSVDEITNCREIQVCNRDDRIKCIPVVALQSLRRFTGDVYRLLEKIRRRHAKESVVLFRLRIFEHPRGCPFHTVGITASDVSNFFGCLGHLPGHLYH